jgi:nitrilase
MSQVPVAVIQAGSVLFDREAATEKVCRLTRDAAASGARLIVFPEAMIGGYPRGFGFGITIGNRTPEGRRLWQRYWDNAVEVPGPSVMAIGEVCRELGVTVAVGVIERETHPGRGTLYCTLLIIGPDGRLIAKHRKLKPTAAERLLWGEGDGSSLVVHDTPLGRIGGLICWENYMPLARMTLYSQGVELYLAPTADPRDTWLATMRHIACEGRCFVLSCNQFTTRSMYPADLQSSPDLRDQPEILCRGGSVIVSPLGEVLAGPMYDQEGILAVTLDRDEVTRAKLDFDVAGNYARPDVFRLSVDRRVQRAVELD